MKRLFFLSLFTVFFLFGCGGGGGSSTSAVADTPTLTNSGVAVDPYLEGAIFCIDENLNGTCDAGEPESTASNANGVFTFTDEVPDDAVVLMKTAGTHNGVPYQFSKMTARYNGGDLIISPLTTLLARDLTEEQIVTLLDPSGTIGLSVDDIGTDPVAVLTAITGSITDEALASVRASIGAYMLLRMIENNPTLADLNGEDLVNNADVQAIAEQMMTFITETITAAKIAEIQALIPTGSDIPDVDIMDVIYTAVTVCEHVMELSEAEYASSGNIGQAMAAVQQFKNTELDDYLENIAPAQFVNRLINNNQVAASLIEQHFGEYGQFAACQHGIHANAHGLPMCYTDDDDDGESDDVSDIEDVQDMIANAPAIDYDFDDDNADTGLAASGVLEIYGRLVAPYSEGACYTNAIRNNASLFVPDVEYYRCALSKVADEELISALEDGVMYIKLLTNSYEHRAKLTLNGDTVTMSVCYDDGNQLVEDTENTRIKIQKLTDGYKVEGTIIRDNHYINGDRSGDVARGSRIFASADTSNAGSDLYAFIAHYLNEEGTNCTGNSGASLTADDDQCFLRYEGNILNVDADSSRLAAPSVSTADAYSLMNGLFAEKGYNSNDNLYYAGTSFATLISGGAGYTKYSQPVAAGFSYVLSAAETWLGGGLGTSFWTTGVSIFPSAITDNLDVPARGVVVPDIETPWDCEAIGDFTSIDLDAVSDISDCSVAPLNGSGDVTTCSEGTTSANFITQMQEYQCDTTDPLTNNADDCI